MLIKLGFVQNNYRHDLRISQYENGQIMLLRSILALELPDLINNRRNSLNTNEL